MTFPMVRGKEKGYYALLRYCQTWVFGDFTKVHIVAFSANVGASFDFTGFLIEFPAAHLFFQAAAFDQLTKTAHGILDGFFVPKR